MVIHIKRNLCTIAAMVVNRRQKPHKFAFVYLIKTTRQPYFATWAIGSQHYSKKLFIQILPTKIRESDHFSNHLNLQYCNNNASNGTEWGIWTLCSPNTTSIRQKPQYFVNSNHNQHEHPITPSVSLYLSFEVKTHMIRKSLIIHFMG
jgi:hypothetical protein